MSSETTKKRNPEYINYEIAQGYIENPESFDLNNATGISEDAARLLSGIDPDTWLGLCLENISEISDVSLTELMHLKNGRLSLGLTQINHSTARILSLFKGDLLKLNKVKFLCPQTAKQLARSQINVYLPAIEIIDDETAEMLSVDPGNIYINGQAEFSKVAAKHLSDNSKLKFTVPVTFSEEICEMFNSDESSLFFGRSRSSIINANYINSWYSESKSSRDISLDGCRLTAKAAEIIVNRKGKKIKYNFGCLYEISLEAAKQFKGYSGDVELHCNYTGHAMLGPSVEVAAALAEMTGKLSIQAKDITHDSATALAEFKGMHLRLQFASEIPAKTKAVLSGNPRIEVVSKLLHQA
jgi:hypothetical protein